jgi:hypothetical protein
MVALCRQVVSVHCQRCYVRLRFGFGHAAFKRAPADAARTEASKRGAVAPRDASAAKAKSKRFESQHFVEGQPLPNCGACKHYAKSKRWLRFPCCGKAYACDICHEEATAGDHEMEWARHQICGFCSHEQPYSQKPCACGAVLASSSKSSHFWEGGKGCRNLAQLSSKDGHKFKNSKFKTKSKKAERVGQAGTMRYAGASTRHFGNTK